MARRGTHNSCSVETADAAVAPVAILLPCMNGNGWRQSQRGLIARRQLNSLGVDADRVRNQVQAGRWVARSSTVISTFTGSLHWAERVWLGVLHAGGGALIGGLTALEWQGLRGWHRDTVTVLVDDELVLEPVPGVTYFRTRRPLPSMAAELELPVARIEPAALLYAGYEHSLRSAQGLLAALVQQRLTTPASLRDQLEAMRPLRRARLFRATLTDIEGGADSLAELDIGRLCRRGGLPRPRRQTMRRDSTGKRRFTDCEWGLDDGRVLILEIDGAFHMDVQHWEDDLARQRRLSGQGRVIVRCTARELRENPDSVLADLKRYGLCA
jgi:hypothetical protein